MDEENDEVNEGCITVLYNCEAPDAKALQIFDISNRLKRNSQYHIGGAYINGQPELWFYYTTTVCPDSNYLLNLFVCHRNAGIFSVGICSPTGTFKPISKTDEVTMSIAGDKIWHKFITTQPDTVHHIQTFHITESERLSLSNTILIIPISIDMNPHSMIDNVYLQRIKAKQDFGEALFKDIKPDFVLKSKSGKAHEVHKIVLAAHSPVIRDAIRADDCKTYCIDMSDTEVELLLQYLYNGYIKDSIDNNYELLLNMAKKYQLQNLATLIKLVIKANVNVSNAFYFAVLAEKYQYDDIQKVIFEFISSNPKALDSDVFSQIDNIDLIKKLLKYIHFKECHQSKLQNCN